MNSKQAKAALAAREKELATLEGQKEVVTQEFQGLEEKRVEGLSSLIRKAEEAVSQAREVLAGAQAQEQIEFNAWADQRQREGGVALLQVAQERKERIYQLFIDLCLELGQLNVIAQKSETLYRQGIGEPEYPAIREILSTLPAQVSEKIRANGHRPLFSGGYIGVFTPWPLVEVPAELAAHCPGLGAVNVNEFTQALLEQERKALFTEFKQERRI